MSPRYLNRRPPLFPDRYTVRPFQTSVTLSQPLLTPAAPADASSVFRSALSMIEIGTRAFGIESLSGDDLDLLNELSDDHDKLHNR